MSDKARENTYDSATAGKKLSKRKMAMDYQKYKEAGKKSSAISTRDVEKEERVFARPYHTNIPSNGLWFYSKDNPPAILEVINMVITSEMFEGTTDYDEKMKAISADSSTSGTAPEDEVNNQEVVVGPQVKPLITDTDSMTAKEAAALRQFRLNYYLHVNKRIQRGVVNIYACPDKPKVNIVMFQAGADANTLLFPKIYAQLLDAGIATLMMNPNTVREELLKFESERERRARKYSVEMAPTLLTDE